MSVFATFASQTRIQAILVMQTALSVSSRLSLEPTGTDMPVIKGPDGLPFIPGSSIKGVVRFQVERILRTWDRRPDFWACDPFDAPCIPAKKKEQLLNDAETDQSFAETVWKESCTACRLFGSPWFAGRVAFRDAYLLNPEDLPTLTQIRDGVGIDRDLGTARSGIKYDFETVIPGARFGLEILAENLEEWEIGFLLTVLRLWEEGGIAIGGKTTRGPGWGKLQEIKIQRVGISNLMDYLLERKSSEVAATQFLQTFREWLKERGAGDA
ncbi:MAG TPA: CRISPR-associated RAMP protein [Chloroflexus aurantiacus]|uniref:CRISPR-associated RAMP protein, SSO1426 family n=1 Tax=Chloroflexus aurantiacus (strain ATCC 29366 / DSM 635 / J-10-fl) TaxID=324602 RepID=A9WGH2_CHLAA|nr:MULTISPECIES: CRISPR-associated RAMP protein Csx7 [Chloroflexus]ABY35504.1 CRISPR-associated RAMP protein, SSO1426 family [Chloroflexus aurantiacus J-10-fl]GIV92052.1 MAG: CRISPR-associated RAMP protein [Chloroflexus sp.]HBW69457.1 CRISPR-associated RAMP protein [Chloroflexus aurantiacus]